MSISRRLVACALVLAPALTLAAARAAHAQTTLFTWELDPETLDFMGCAVSGAGDVDGDGHVDVLVGARNDLFYQGSAHLYSGQDGEELMSWASPTLNDRFGWSVTGVGDVDGDGTPDVLVGAPQKPVLGSFMKPGYADLYSGADGHMIRRFLGGAPGDDYGFFVGQVGDLDGDGCREFVIGAPRHDGPATDCGMAEIRSGRTMALMLTFTGDEDYDHLGWSVADAGDVDDDGTPDVVVGVPSEYGEIEGGHVRVYSGATGEQLWSAEGGAYDVFLGHSVSGAGDLDLDGHADVLVSAPGDGRVVAYSGATGAELYAVTTDWYSYPEGVVRSFGDLDSDGIDDFFVTSPNDILSYPGDPRRGSITFHSGADGALLWRFFHDKGEFGASAEPAGDVDGDGRPDLVVGNPKFQGVGGGDAGRAYAFSIHPWLGLGSGLSGSEELPLLWGQGSLAAGTVVGLELASAKPAAPVTLVTGYSVLAAPFKGGVLVPFPDLLVSGLATSALGSLSLSAPWPGGVPTGLEFIFQAWIVDAGGVQGLAASNGVSAVSP